MSGVPLNLVLCRHHCMHGLLSPCAWLRQGHLITAQLRGALGTDQAMYTYACQLLAKTLVVLTERCNPSS
jgi:hypothetical protein